MPNGVEFDLSQFHSALDKYAQVSKRDFADIVNKRAINIAFISMRKTPAAQARSIKASLMRRVKGNGRKGKGRPPIAALMIASGSKKAGLVGKPSPGLYGAKMREEIEGLVKRRVRTRAYIKSGFLKAIRGIEPYVKGRAKRRPQNIKKFSKEPGKGKRAIAVIKPVAVIINYATEAKKIAGPAIQAAINADARDMVKYAEKVMAKRAREASA